MRKLLLLMLVNMLHTGLFSQKTVSVSGRITDKMTNAPLSGATISILGTSVSTIADNEGNFHFKKINPGKITLLVSYIGYETIEHPLTITEQKAIVADLSLNMDERTGNGVVVSASKRREKITDAPSSIQVIGKNELEQFTGSNTFELLSKVQGVEFTRTGVDHASINARGLNNAFNNRVFQMVDGRNSMNALSGSLPMHNNFSLVKDDIERIEIVLGPQTALYGPNAHNAIINFITKDPRTSQGTIVSMSVGNQCQFSGRFRQATKINNKWAYKFSGEYATGKEFPFYDSVYAGGTVYGPQVAIPEKNIDFNFRHIRGEAHVYYSVTPKADIIISVGGSNNNSISTHTGGHIQFKDVTNSFLQARYVSSHFFVNVYNAWGNFGNSLQIGGYTRDFWNRTHSLITDSNDPRYKNMGRLPPDSAEIFATRYGNRVKETPQRLNAEAQYNTKFENIGLLLVTGFSYQKDKPRAYGIALIDSFQRIYVTQVGAVLQLEKKLQWGIRLFTAIRWDNHSNFGNFYSPKFGIIKKIGDGNFRITWGKAYSMPSILNQYSNGSSSFGNGEGITYIPNSEKLTAPVLKTTIPLKPVQVHTCELGYKGTIAKKLYIDINYFNGLNKNFIGPSLSVGGRALYAGKIRISHTVNAGDVGADGILRNARFSTIFNFGDVRVYGIDAGLTHTFNKYINLSVKCSWLGSDITEGHADNDGNKDDTVSVDERSLNSPTHHGAVILSFQNLCKQKLFITLSARYVEQYDFYSGNQISTAAGEGRRGVVYGKVSPTTGQRTAYIKNFDWGSLGGFVSIDLSARYKINSMMSVGMNITNLFDIEQREFAGSTYIRRLIMFELKVQVPNTKK